VSIGSAFIAILILNPAAPPERSSQDESLRAAAQLTGLTTGMASACQLKTTPVLHAFRDLMDRKRVLGAQRKRLVALVAEANQRGASNQHKPGAMSCEEVKAQVRSTIRRLNRAK
jgi:hypothetical protein